MPLRCGQAAGDGCPYFFPCYGRTRVLGGLFIATHITHGKPIGKHTLYTYTKFSSSMQLDMALAALSQCSPVPR